MRIRSGRALAAAGRVVVFVTLACGAAAAQTQDLIVDILTAPNNYWNKPVTLKGHVVRVSPDPPGTSRGRFTFRDQSDRDIEVTTNDLPPQGKVFVVKGVVEQRQPGDVVPIVREMARSETDAAAPIAAATPKAAPSDKPASTPRPATVAPPAVAPPAAAAAAPAPQPAAPAAVPVTATTVPTAWWQDTTTLVLAGAAVLAVLLIGAATMRRRPAPARPAARVAGAGAVQQSLPAYASTRGGAASGDATVVVDRGTELFAPRGASMSVTEGPDRGRGFTIGRAVTTLGRGGQRKNDIELTDTTISRDQARIVLEGTGYTLINESTTNPTRVNGQTIERHPLSNGDTIEFGATVLKFTQA